MDVFANFVKQHVKWLQLKVYTKTKLCAFRALNFDYVTDKELQLVGTGRFELPTSRLSVVRSNQLSYAPVAVETNLFSLIGRNSLGSGK